MNLSTAIGNLQLANLLLQESLNLSPIYTITFLFFSNAVVLIIAQEPEKLKLIGPLISFILVFIVVMYLGESSFEIITEGPKDDIALIRMSGVALATSYFCYNFESNGTVLNGMPIYF